MKYFFLLILLPILSFAQDCSTINYLTEANSPFEKIPVADQDGTGICYAYSSSQLMDYYLIKSGQTQTQSMHPAWTATKSSASELRSGSEDLSINAVRAAGSCNYQDVENALDTFGAFASVSGSQLVNFIENYAVALGKGQDRGAAFYTAVNTTAPYCAKDTMWDMLLPDISPLAGTSVEMFTRILGDSCKSSQLRHFNIPAPVRTVIRDDALAAPTINSLLERGPMTMGYCSQIWYDNRTYDGFDRNSYTAIPGCRPHSSLIVGRKMIGGSCHSLVRNSWGTGWGAWNEDHLCICRDKRTREWVDQCNPRLHSSDRYTVEACYIDQATLSVNVFDVT
ncbi:MAG: hypothetical protein ACJ76H_13360, partial [Bacteriovoracaceae bacterium]